MCHSRLFEKLLISANKWQQGNKVKLLGTSLLDQIFHFLWLTFFNNTVGYLEDACTQGNIIKLFFVTTLFPSISQHHYLLIKPLMSKNMQAQLTLVSKQVHFSLTLDARPLLKSEFCYLQIIVSALAQVMQWRMSQTSYCLQV